MRRWARSGDGCAARGLGTFLRARLRDGLVCRNEVALVVDRLLVLRRGYIAACLMAASKGAREGAREGEERKSARAQHRVSSADRSERGKSITASWKVSRMPSQSVCAAHSLAVSTLPYASADADVTRNTHTPHTRGTAKERGERRSRLCYVPPLQRFSASRGAAWPARLLGVWCRRRPRTTSALTPRTLSTLALARALLLTSRRGFCAT